MSNNCTQQLDIIYILVLIFRRPKQLFGPLGGQVIDKVKTPLLYDMMKSLVKIRAQCH